MTAEWRTFAKPEEIAEHDGLIEQAKANAKRRTLIRNRCRMRGKQSANRKTEENPSRKPAQ